MPLLWGKNTTYISRNFGKKSEIVSHFKNLFNGYIRSVMFCFVKYGILTRVKCGWKSPIWEGNIKYLRDGRRNRFIYFGKWEFHRFFSLDAENKQEGGIGMVWNNCWKLVIVKRESEWVVGQNPNVTWSAEQRRLLEVVCLVAWILQYNSVFFGFTLSQSW